MNFLCLISLSAMGGFLLLLLLQILKTTNVFTARKEQKLVTDGSVVVHLDYPEHTALYHDTAILALSATSCPADLRKFMELYSECPIISSDVSKQWLREQSVTPAARLVYALAYEFPNKLFVYWIKYGPTTELKSWALSVQMWLAEQQINHPTLPYKSLVTRWIRAWDISDTGFTVQKMVLRIKQAAPIFGDWMRFEPVTKYASGKPIAFHPECGAPSNIFF